MKKITLCLSLVFLFLNGCSEDSPVAGTLLEGYIVDKKEHSLLVISDITKEEMNTMSIDEILKQLKTAA